MKIGKITIDVHFDQEIGKIYLTTAPEEVPQESQSTAKVEEEVQLDPDSDDFEEKKAALKAEGYFFNRSSKTWRKKKGSATVDANVSQTPTPAAGICWYGDATEIQLSKDDPDFAQKKETLKKEGFRWDGTAKTWRKSGE